MHAQSAPAGHHHNARTGPTWPEGKSIDVIDLPPLDRADAAALLESVCAEKAISQTESILSRADGVPLYLELSGPNL